MVVEGLVGAGEEEGARRPLKLYFFFYLAFILPLAHFFCPFLPYSSFFSFGGYGEQGIREPQYDGMELYRFAEDCRSGTELITCGEKKRKTSCHDPVGSAWDRINTNDCAYRERDGA